MPSRRVALTEGTYWHISTVELDSRFVLNANRPFETCLFFTDGESEVLERYETEDAALVGHEQHVAVQRAVDSQMRKH